MRKGDRERTLAERLGVTAHVSPLRRKLERVRARFPCREAAVLEDWLVDLANARGARAVTRLREGESETAGEESFPDRAEVSDVELVVAICQPQGRDRPQALRLAAQLITRGGREIDLEALLFMARRERVERILAELARQALRVDPDHVGWRRIAEAFGDERSLRDSLVHWTRLAEPVMQSGRPNATGWKLVG